ncbi:hypothetical protein MPLA_2140043 [Mesorhizobium sp. ORS 3359]|uniref:Uncharacterized protein n=1 Tax=Mesorhizobium plurifarium TaxID=69974 RepID=A0A090GUY5_MESPL|nr:hypothetical protein MPLA_2140043 [Mesorhizobium sp. ORS 3359]CDX58114.1 hypothetical protein MPL3365_290097 [Mesorhizobium plurifarium]
MNGLQIGTKLLLYIFWQFLKGFLRCFIHKLKLLYKCSFSYRHSYFPHPT